jgi:hypothetical protein
MNASTLVQKLWNYCNVLRDDGMSYGDYVEQLPHPRCLKFAIAHETVVAASAIRIVATLSRQLAGRR